VEVKVGFIGVGLVASIRDGRLAIDPRSFPGWAPPALASEAAAFLDRLNDWFGANGVALAPFAFGPDGVTLRKVPARPSGE
jgi:hypothetical protein